MHNSGLSNMQTLSMLSAHFINYWILERTFATLAFETDSYGVFTLKYLI